MMDARVEAYLRTVRMRLRGFPPGGVQEIVEELRSHIIDKTAQTNDVDEVLAALGDPAELAGRYIAGDALARAETSRTPAGVLDGLFRWATLSIAGFFVLVVSIAGYFVGAALLLCALVKPFRPETAGLWRSASAADVSVSLRMGFGSPPAGAHDVLGFWIVPIGLIGGAAIITLTTRFALWCMRQSRGERELPS